MKIINESKAGCQVWLGDGLVRFDDAGVALGVVKRDGHTFEPPAALNESQFEQARRAAGYVVEEGEASEAAAQPPQPPAEAVDEPEAPDGASDATEAAVEATDAASDVGEAEAEDVEPEAAVEPGADLPDLETMTKGDLYKLAQDLKLDLDWTGTTSDEFREGIRMHWRSEGILDE